MALCDSFINCPPGQYRPLACKPIVVTTRELRGHGYANKLDLFFLIKPNTFREHATIDLLYPTPSWLKDSLQPSAPITLPAFARVTKAGDTRVIDTGLIRVATN